MAARFTLFAIAVALVLASSPAWGQNAEAAKAFDRGKQLRDEGKCKEALSEFQKSIAIERSIGAFYNLGICSDTLAEQKAHDPSSPPRNVLKRQAYAAFRMAEHLAVERKDDRLREIGAQILSFLRNAPHVRLAVADRPAGLKIQVDGEDVPLDTEPAKEIYFFTKDAGDHTIEASAPGYEISRYKSDSSGGAAVPIVLRRPAPPAPEANGLGWQAWTGIGVAGAGLVAAGVFAYLYVNHRARLDDLRTNTLAERQAPCPSPPAPLSPMPSEQERTQFDERTKSRTDCLSRALTDTNAEITEENASQGPTIAMAATSFVLLTLGAVLFFTAPSPSDPKRSSSVAPKIRVVPDIGAQRQGIMLVGTF